MDIAEAFQTQFIHSNVIVGSRLMFIKQLSVLHKISLFTTFRNEIVCYITYGYYSSVAIRDTLKMSR